MSKSDTDLSATQEVDIACVNWHSMKEGISAFWIQVCVLHTKYVHNCYVGFFGMVAVCNDLYGQYKRDFYFEYRMN